MNPQTKSVCVVCGAEFKDGIGFTELHYEMCRNDYMGENWTRAAPIGWKRPTKGEAFGDGVWNRCIRERWAEEAAAKEEQAEEAKG